MRLETEKEVMISKQVEACGYSKQIGVYAIAAVVNALQAEGAEEFGLGVRVAIPAFGYTSRIHGIEKHIRAICRQRGYELLELEGKKHPALRLPQVTVTGIARAEQTDKAGKENLLRSGNSIVFTKWLGMEGMVRIAEEKEESLKERFSAGFLKQIQSYRESIFAEKEILTAMEQGNVRMEQVGEGGVLAALWRLSAAAGSGIRVDMKRLPILQETVEVCECFHLNPYQLASAGSFLMVTEKAEALCQRLAEQGIPASIIGQITDNNDKIIQNGEEIRYIDRPAPDEIYKIFET